MPLRLNTTELMRGAGEDEGEDGGVAGAPEDKVKEEGAVERERKKIRLLLSPKNMGAYPVLYVYAGYITSTWFCAYG